MCIDATRLRSGVFVACRKCWQCTENRINDYAGRCIAESKFAVKTNAITWTYGRVDDQVHHEAAAVLTYSDIQKYVKRLRTAGFPCRYLITGEYGTERGRTHWHGIMFWGDKPPEHKLYERFNGAKWDHGFQWWTEPTFQSIRYCVKYINKDTADEAAQSMLHMSRYPILGASYFTMLGIQHVRDGIAPKDLFYRFAEAKKKNGRPHQFMMRGKTVDVFLSAYVAAWQVARPSEWMKSSALVDEWLDKQVEDWRVPDKWPRAALDIDKIVYAQADDPEWQEIARIIRAFNDTQQERQWNGETTAQEDETDEWAAARGFDLATAARYIETHTRPDSGSHYRQ